MYQTLHLEQRQDFAHLARHQSVRPVMFGTNGFNQLSRGTHPVEEVILHQIL
jgi:hypothetical protein